MTTLRLALASVLFLPITPPQPQTAPAPTIQVNTRLTVVDVTVTDKYGHPVHGLKASDFTIKEDGKPQPFRNFDEYGAAPPTIPMTPGLPPGIYTNIPTGPPANGAVNILLFNQLGSGQDMMYAQSQALNYLKTMPQNTRVAILVLENGVRIVQNITTDRDILVAAVHGISYHPVGGATFAGVSSFAVACSVANQQSRLTLDALRQIAASFAAIHGRKNLIWFTHGIPWLTNISYYRSYLRIDCLDDDTQQLQAAYGMLSASQVTISTVDPRGLYGTTADFIERQLNQESIRDLPRRPAALPTTTATTSMEPSASPSPPTRTTTPSPIRRR